MFSKNYYLNKLGLFRYKLSVNSLDRSYGKVNPRNNVSFHNSKKTFLLS